MPQALGKCRNIETKSFIDFTFPSYYCKDLGGHSPSLLGQGEGVRVVAGRKFLQLGDKLSSLRNSKEVCVI